MTPKSVPKDDFISGVVPLGAPLVALTVLGHQTLAPSGPKVPPMIQKSTKNDTKDTLQLRKKTPKFKFFGNLAWQTAQSAYNTNCRQLGQASGAASLSKQVGGLWRGRSWSDGWKFLMNFHHLLNLKWLDVSQMNVYAFSTTMLTACAWQWGVLVGWLGISD